MSQDSYVTLLDVNVSGAQIVENYGKQVRIAIDEQGSAFDSGARYSAAEQGSEKRVRNPGERLARSGEPKIRDIIWSSHG